MGINISWIRPKEHTVFPCDVHFHNADSAPDTPDYVSVIYCYRCAGFYGFNSWFVQLIILSSRSSGLLRKQHQHVSGGPGEGCQLTWTGLVVELHNWGPVSSLPEHSNNPNFVIVMHSLYVSTHVEFLGHCLVGCRHLLKVFWVNKKPKWIFLSTY